MDEKEERDWTQVHKDENGLADNIQELREMVHYLATVVHVLCHPLYGLLVGAAGLDEGYQRDAKIMHDATCARKTERKAETTDVPLATEDSEWLSNLLTEL